MLTITHTKKSLTETPAKYCRLTLTEDSADWHRLVETTDGHLEYRLGRSKASKITRRTFRTLIRSIVQAAKSHQIEHLAIDIAELTFDTLTPYGRTWLIATIVENLHLAHYDFKHYKSKPEKKKTLTSVLLCNATDASDARSIADATILATTVNDIRDIANTTGGDMTPESLAAAAKRLATGTSIKTTIHDVAALKKLKMNLLLAVGQGAAQTPRLIVMEYRGAGATTAPTVFIGKGVTFDSGGLNVKPVGAMHDMHLDMSGGAAVIGAIVAAARLKLKRNIVALVPAAENAISDRSMRAGDIVTSMSGKTVEILHTDAEGRLILADAYTYAERYKPAQIIDVATLTGASLVALGQHASAILTKDDTLAKTLTELGEATGEYVWPLPLWDEYQQYLKSSRADVSNIATSFAKWGGCIEGATFLSFFAPKKTPWAHIDIAPRMDSIPSDKLAKGATGEPVRLLVSFLKEN
jgi:leucyl aminopeptidase